MQIAQTERGSSEVSSVIDQDNQGFLKATPTIHAVDSRPSDFTFAHMAAQTDSLESEDPLDVPGELKQTIGCHLWLADLEASAAITQECFDSLYSPASTSRRTYSVDYVSVA